VLYKIENDWMNREIEA